MSTNRYQAVLCDLDGVVTSTATLHARAWKDAFDEYLAELSAAKGVTHDAFDERADYERYVDGRPRYDGVRSFLASRDLELPDGDPDDPPEARTVCGLGNRKNERFLELLQTQGAQTYPDAVRQLERWRRLGMKTALVTSSRNGRAIVESAHLGHLFDVLLDWSQAAELGLRGKPAPDIFLEAAQQLGVPPDEAVVLEDAISGVEAGRAGGFGLVVGVARHRDRALTQHGADLEVQDLGALGDLSSG